MIKMGQITSVSLSNYRAYCGGFVPPIATLSTELSSTKQKSSNNETKLPNNNDTYPQKDNKDILISHDQTTYTWLPHL